MSSDDESSVRFRIANPQDASAILTLSHECRLATYPEHIPESQRERFLHYERTRCENNQELAKTLISRSSRNEWRMVASYGDQIVGHIYCQVDNQIMQIRNLFILPNFQGQGIGKSLLKKALDWSPVGVAHLRVLATNTPAIKLYNHYGFVPNGRTISYFGCTKLEMVRVT